MATNTAASFTSHTGNNTAGPFSISFSYLSEDEIDVTVDGVLKTKTTHYTFPSATTISFTSGNHPANNAAIKFQRDTNISAKRVDFEDGSILTETDLDTNTEHLLYGLQEVLNHVDTKVFGSTQIADSAITSAKIADGTVATGDIADDAVTSAKIADNAITSAHIADGTVVAADIGANAVTASELADNAVDTAAIANSAVTTAKLADANITTAKIADDAVTAAKLADDAVTAAKIGTFNLADLTNVHTATPSDGQVLKYVNSNSRWEPAADAQGSVTDGDYGEITVSSSGAAFTIDNGVVTTAKLADDAVTAAKIADGSITSAHIAADTVVAADVAANAITASELADNAVDTAAIADNAVTNAKLADDAIGIAELSATGTASSSTFLRGDNTWVTPTDTNTQLTTEEVQDIVGAMFTGNTETNIAATYEDSDGTIDLVVSTGAGGLTNLVEDTSPQLGGNLDVNGKIISLGDSSGTTEDRIVLGTGSDFHIYHPGTDSMIDNNTGNLILRCNVNADVGGDIKLQPKAGEEGIKVIHDGGVELYHDGNLQCKTASYGLDFADNKRADFGTGNDLLIYHDGTDSYITNATNELIFKTGSNFDFQVNDSENAIKATANGAVELSYDGSIQAKTTSTGFMVQRATGDAYIIVEPQENASTADAVVRLRTTHYHATCKIQFGDDGDPDAGVITYSNEHDYLKFTVGTNVVWRMTSDGHLESNSDSGKLKLGASDDLEIYHDGSHSYIKDSGTGDLVLQASTARIINAAATENIARFFENGACELYYDNSKKLETVTGGVSVTGDVTATGNVALLDDSLLKLGTSDDFVIHHDSTSGLNYIDSKNRNLVIRRTGSETDTMAQFAADGAVELYYDNSKKFETTSGGGTLTGDWTVTNDLFLNDSGEAVFGTGGDLKIYHDGTDSYIVNVTNQLIYHSGTDHKFRVNDGNENSIWAKANGAVELYYDNVKKLETTSAGVTVTGSLTETSDIALKHDINTIQNPLDLIKQIRGINFTWSTNGMKSMGVIAQDVEKVFPELVHGSDGSKSLQYSGLIGALVESVKELSAKVAALESA